MENGFSDCVKNGGKVKTKQLKNNKFIRICYDNEGNSFASPIRTNKKSEIVLNNSQDITDKLIELRSFINSNYHI